MAATERSVFVTVGTTKFDELVKRVDSLDLLRALRDKGYTRLIIQKGNGAYCPSVVVPKGQTKALTEGIAVEYFDYSPSLAAYIASAALVISHAGSGSIFETLTAGVPLIVVPNPLLMDNHQVELGEQLAALGHLVSATPDELLDAVRSFDAGRLLPYSRGDPAAVVGRINRLVGLAPA
ncbi:UDP-N-acetylglucosamine transferase subunit ALG13 [Tetrabaena socialis]|uniref:UDP-N-acetylglucosamine transferase subunit ALG13 n=1 Tax=Tetrabaena socialis TaxID=47790 RepID=A0A2J8AC50_9CHLO|nr:UDP-N-acetylglucosamine transferase subunit ALG13 [Tetrabaena socialis]|eukprot:PNH10077.1 UDP-N-acetylglucosamine transferase subunit ALG13 [Tetrabaena socialis]